MDNAFQALLQAYQTRFQGVDKPQFYNAWEPNADPQMQLSPAPNHPAMGDKNNMRPEDVPIPPSYGYGSRPELSAIARLMNIG